MADVVNLGRARKAKAAAAARVVAAQNRVASGLTKDQKAAAARAKLEVARAVDGHKREP